MSSYYEVKPDVSVLLNCSVILVSVGTFPWMSSVDLVAAAAG